MAQKKLQIGILLILGKAIIQNRSISIIVVVVVHLHLYKMGAMLILLRGRPEMTSLFGLRGEVSQKMTVDDRGEGGSQQKNDAVKYK